MVTKRELWKVRVRLCGRCVFVVTPAGDLTVCSAPEISSRYGSPVDSGRIYLWFWSPEEKSRLVLLGSWESDVISIS